MHSAHDLHEELRSYLRLQPSQRESNIIITMLWLTLKSGSIGSANIIYKKFSVYDFFLSGWTIGRPLLVLNEIAAKVGNLATNLIAASSLYFASLMSVSLKNELKAPTTPHIIAIGWALGLYPL